MSNIVDCCILAEIEKELQLKLTEPLAGYSLLANGEGSESRLGSLREESTEEVNDILEVKLDIEVSF